MSSECSVYEFGWSSNCDNVACDGFDVSDGYNDADSATVFGGEGGVGIVTRLHEGTFPICS